MSKSSPRRRTRRYDEDFEYFVPLRNNTSKKNEGNSSPAADSADDTPRRKRGRPPGSKNVIKPDGEAVGKRGPGRPRKYTAEAVKLEPEPESETFPEEEGEGTEGTPREVDLNEKPRKQLDLGEVLEMAVKSALNPTVEGGDRTDDEKMQELQENEAKEEENSDFEWKLGNDEEYLPPVPASKRARISQNQAGRNDDSEPATTNETEDSGNEEGIIRIRTLTDSEGAKIECLTCHRVMKPGSLRAHLRTHAHERPHTCDMCEARFTRRGDLERHIKVIHHKERPFKCSKCHRTFGDKKNLRWHLANHDRKLFYHCQECGFKFGKREYWENHVRYIHPIPGGEVEILPTDGGESEGAGTATATPPKGPKMPAILPKGTPLTLSRVANQRKSLDPFSGLQPQKVVFPPTYWDNWEEFMERNMVLNFRPKIEKFGSQGRPLRRKKIPDTIVELKPAERPDSSFDTDRIPEDQPILDEKEGAFISSTGELVGYPEEMFKVEGEAAQEYEEEEEEEEEAVREPEEEQAAAEMALGEDGNMESSPANGEVLATHHLVYGEDGQVRLILGSGSNAAAGDVVPVAEENEDLSVSHAFVEANGQIVILQPDGSAVLAPPGGQLLDTGDGQLILLQTLEDGTQTAVAYTAAPQDPLQQGEDIEETEETEETDVKPDTGESNQDAVQTLIDAVQELIDNRDKPS